MSRCHSFSVMFCAFFSLSQRFSDVHALTRLLYFIPAWKYCEIRYQIVATASNSAVTVYFVSLTSAIDSICTPSATLRCTRVGAVSEAALRRES